MAEFVLDGITLFVPETQLTPPLEKALRTGRYEGAEANALRRHLVENDRVLDMGAGAGFISTLAARAVGAENVIAVEPNPSMIDALRGNLAANDVEKVQVLHGAVVPDSQESDTVPFAARSAFWASSVSENGQAQVPALRFTPLMRRAAPSVVVMDIEGGEAALSGQDWPDCVRLLVMEIHTNRYGPDTVKAMFDNLSRAGFTYMPWGTRGEVVVLQRVPPDISPAP